MMTCRKKITGALLPGAAVLCLLTTFAVRAYQQTSQERETDPLVLEKLAWFQDMKFGLMMHWGPYSQWGVVESWSICSEDEPWCQRNMDNYVEYCRKYEQLKTTFNPVKFDPDKWAAAAKYAGMRYLVFTTKHHDGFCMFDTRQTDYCITDPGCPFHANPRANITRELFDAFRKQGFGIGAYFSKPDWHSPWYWSPYWAHADRNVNYSVAKHPDKWRHFCDYTYNQIEELMTGYGQVDILWLDGGWVNPGNRGQDINMPRVAAMARSHQPGLIVVDRTVTGRYENYRTPEQEVPEKPLDYPWETCMTMGKSWSFNPKEEYKPAGELIHLLVDIVAKGGNFLLNIGPNAEGELPPVSLARLKEIGDWMKVNSSAIYSTRPVPPYKEGKICYTKMPGGSVNAIYLAEEGEDQMPAKVTIRSFCPMPDSRVILLGTSAGLEWEKSGTGVVVRVPEAIRNAPPCRHAWTFSIERPLQAR
jgi:alpha-L-fucosidase